MNDRYGQLSKSIYVSICNDEKCNECLKCQHDKALKEIARLKQRKISIISNFTNKVCPLCRHMGKPEDYFK